MEDIDIPSEVWVGLPADNNAAVIEGLEANGSISNGEPIQIKATKATQESPGLPAMMGRMYKINLRLLDDDELD
jgi:hypothetical protein